MKFRTFCLVVTLCIMAFIYGQARADESLDKLLGTKQVEYVGSCWINKKQEIVFKQEDSIGQQRCVVGFETGNQNERWVLLYNGNKLDRLVHFQKKTATKPEKQEVIWRNPDGMV